MPVLTIHVGCAGWPIPKDQSESFPGEGSHLSRYARQLPGVEINSSFYRPHRPSTYARWAAETPQGFAFAVKVPREITHKRRLVDVDEPLDRFLDETASLGVKRGPLLVQLPPSLPFRAEVVGPFFTTLRNRFTGDLACEPRHRSWFTSEVDRLLAEHRVARVAADPAVLPQAALPGGWNGLVYYRLHGSPRMYYSPYDTTYLDSLTQTLVDAAVACPVWCVFDNTALGAATADALGVWHRLARSGHALPLSTSVAFGEPRKSATYLGRLRTEAG